MTTDDIYTPLDREWFYYNFAAGSFHTKTLCSRLYSSNVNKDWTQKDQDKDKDQSHEDKDKD